MEKYDFENLNGEQWAQLLCEHPEFATECSWEKLGSEDWCWLLSERPEFATHCNWGKIEGYEWSVLLAEQPQFSGLRNTFSVNSLKSSHLLKCNVYSLRAKFHPIRLEAQLRF